MVGAGNFWIGEVTDGYGDVSGKAFALPVDGGAACRTEIKGQRVPALGFALAAAATGLFSLLLWRWTGDLRLYAWVQFFPFLALLLLFLLFSGEIHRHILLACRRDSLCAC